MNAENGCPQERVPIGLEYEQTRQTPGSRLGLYRPAGQ